MFVHCTLGCEIVSHKIKFFVINVLNALSILGLQMYKVRKLVVNVDKLEEIR